MRYSDAVQKILDKEEILEKGNPESNETQKETVIFQSRIVINFYKYLIAYFNYNYYNVILLFLFYLYNVHIL